MSPHQGLRVARDIYREPAPLDHQSDLERNFSVNSLPYHFEHYAHNSLALYSPGEFGYFDHDSDHLDHIPYQKDSTENDVSPTDPLVTDSVLQYIDMHPFSLPHFTQEPGASGGLGDAPQGQEPSGGHRRDIEQGRIDYTGRDRFENIARHIDAILQSGPQEDQS